MEVIVAAICIFVLITILSNNYKKYDLVCKSCGYAGRLPKSARGSIAIEFALYLLLILPGIIYSIWRRSEKVATCPHCSGHDLIPANSLIAKKILNS